MIPPKPGSNRRALADARRGPGLRFASLARLGHVDPMARVPKAVAAVRKDWFPSLPLWPVRTPDGPLLGRRGWNGAPRGAAFRPVGSFPFSDLMDALRMRSGRRGRISAPELLTTRKRGSLSCTNLSPLWAWFWRLPPATARSIRTAPAWAPWPVACWVPRRATTLPTAPSSAVSLARSLLTRACAADLSDAGRGPLLIHEAIRDAGAFRMAFFFRTPRQRAARQDPRGGTACSRRS